MMEQVSEVGPLAPEYSWNSECPCVAPLSEDGEPYVPGSPVKTGLEFSKICGIGALVLIGPKIKVQHLFDGVSYLL